MQPGGRIRPHRPVAHLNHTTINERTVTLSNIVMLPFRDWGTFSGRRKNAMQGMLRFVAKYNYF